MDIISPRPLSSSCLKTSKIYRSSKNGINVPSPINSTQTLICWEKKYVDSYPRSPKWMPDISSEIFSVQQRVREKKNQCLLHVLST